MGRINENKIKSCLRKDNSDGKDSNLYNVEILGKTNIIYRPEYNITFAGIENLHPFDSKKWGKVYQYLKEAKIISDKTVIYPLEATQNDLLQVHSQSYLNKLKWSINVARITEVPPAACLPNFLLQRYVLKPMRYQTGGTILAGKIAIENQWAINIGGGFHHCHAEDGGGFCPYADITLCIHFMFNKMNNVSSVMIVDLDAHQGNGHERDFMNDRRVYIMDVYNRHIYPHDEYAKQAISRKVELESFTADREYLSKVEKNLEKALQEFPPDIIIYNAGTDILERDPLGLLSITPQGIIRRDEIVFSKAKTRNIPIVMVTSGGYQPRTARVIADSILNLHAKALISPYVSSTSNL